MTPFPNNSAPSSAPHSCRWCQDRGCLACDHLRAVRHREQQLLDLARPFVRAQRDGGFLPEGARVEDDVLLLIGAAVEYGRRQERLLGVPAAAQPEGGRFDFVEIDPRETGDENNAL